MEIRLSELVKLSPKQKSTLQYIGHGYNVLFGGGRGSGKSWLMLWAAVFAAILHPGIEIAIIRMLMPEMRKSFIRPFLATVPEELYKFKERDSTAYFTNGSFIDFLGLASEKDASKIKGPSYGLICIDEANTLEVELIHRILGSLRSTKAKSFEPTLFMTGNPGERSDHYLITRYVEPDYKLWTDEELRNKDRHKYIHATVHDNPDEEYVRRYLIQLKSLPEHLRKQWLEGDWTCFEGQFFEEWDRRYHVCTPFKIPDNWKRYRSVDHGGGAHPSVCLWGAQDPVTETIYIYREVATKRVTSLFIEEIIGMSPPNERIIQTFADTSMWKGAHDHYDSESAAYMFLRSGIPLTKAIKDRINGWRMVKQWMHWSEEYDENGQVLYVADEQGILKPKLKKPKLVFFETCNGCIDSLPRLKYTKSTSTQKSGDLDTDQLDDYADTLRYLIIGAFGYPLKENDVNYKDDAVNNEIDMEEEYVPTQNKRRKISHAKYSWSGFM